MHFLRALEEADMTTKPSASPISLRILYHGARPIHWSGGERDFGLQDKDEILHPGTPDQDGRITFNVPVDVKYNTGGEPVFSGPFTHGPPANRFLYLSWRNANGTYAMRFKLPLSAILGAQIERAIKTGQPITGLLSVPVQRATQTGANIGGTREIAWT